jgi:uncharacterized membrane protein YfcA
MNEEFLLFALIGFAAQLVDGALGMAYGVVASTMLLSFGAPPATASAAVHAAKVFTTAASAGSHILHKNVNWLLFALLGLGGIIGGAAGTYFVTSIDGDLIEPYIMIYLALMGVIILWRAIKGFKPRKPSMKVPFPLGLVGGFVDAVGGGGWGPTVTSTLVGSGTSAREAVGTVNTAEFVVACAISGAFVWAILSGHWTDVEGLRRYAWSVGGLIVGGVIAAPMAAWITRILPVRLLTWIVGLLIIALSGYQAARMFKLF